ncbi:hypothetical protein GPK34_05580 [Secundilactobacillus kimchicus]|uniref:hypothetical protein n=1 Tax=Secundilactobacillus kimchicus TaxID=528209 RepID=UPI001C00E714|nr:hypothetical protein [Secundilactobacillus kimchicus]MBT9671495.1 hypothetical protein [Secundilactobacillus kimchicus]
MNKSVLGQLIRINLLYANPQSTQKLRQRSRSNRRLTWALVRQYVLAGLMLAVLYGFLLTMVDLVRNKGLFDNFLGVFAIFSLSQGISIINNVFFESKDQAAYLPLPISARLVFLAKMMVVLIAVAPMTLPILYVFVATGFKAAVNPVLAVVVGLLLFGLVVALMTLLGAFIVFGLARTKLFQQHQKLVTFGLLFISFAAMMAGILMLNFSTASTTSVTAGIPVLNWFHDAVTNPLSLASGGLIGSLVILVAVLAWGTDRWLLNQFLVGPTRSTMVTRKPHQVVQRSFRQRLVRYNLGLLQSPTLLLQAVSMALLPFIMMGAGLLTDSHSRAAIAALPIRFSGLFLVVGVLAGAITVNSSSLVSVSISLDRANLEYILAMPISLKRYLRIKFWTVYGVQAVMVAVLAVAVAVFLQLPVWHTAALIAGLLVGVYLMSVVYFARDWRLRDLDWSNVTTLFNRGGGNFLTFAVIFGGYIIGAIVVFMDYMAISVMGGLVATGLVLLVLLAVGALVVWWFDWHYWSAHLTENLH